MIRKFVNYNENDLSAIFKCPVILRSCNDFEKALDLKSCLLKSPYKLPEPTKK